MDEAFNLSLVRLARRRSCLFAKAPAGEGSGHEVEHERIGRKDHYNGKSLEVLSILCFGFGDVARGDMGFSGRCLRSFPQTGGYVVDGACPGLSGGGLDASQSFPAKQSAILEPQAGSCCTVLDFDATPPT